MSEDPPTVSVYATDEPVRIHVRTSKLLAHPMWEGFLFTVGGTLALSLEFAVFTLLLRVFA